MSRKKFFVFNKILITALIILFFVGFFFIYKSAFAPDFDISIIKNDKKVSMLFVGDIMLSRQIEKIMYQEQDPLYYFLRLKDFTSTPDITFGNLETSVSLRGENVGSIYSFRSHPDFLKGPKYGGFDVLSIANNHTLDWGPTAFLDTIKHVKENDMFPVGGGLDILEARKPVVIEKMGVRTAFLAYSQFANKNPIANVPAIAPLDVDWIKEDISLIKDKVDIVIVSIHWGNEYEINANEDQKYIARDLIDSGAKLIIGHHPHVIQEVEEYKDGLIAYSLGNFVFDQNFSKDTKKGMILSVDFKNNQIDSFKTTIVNFTERFQPYIPE